MILSFFPLFFLISFPSISTFSDMIYSIPPMFIKLKNAWTRRGKEEKKKKGQRSKSHYVLKKKSKYLVFNLIFLLDYCCMKGLDKQQNQEKVKSHQSRMVTANAE